MFPATGLNKLKRHTRVTTKFLECELGMMCEPNYGVDLLVSGVLPVLQDLNYRLCIQRNNCRGNQQYCVVHFYSMFARLGTDYEINNQ